MPRARVRARSASTAQATFSRCTGTTAAVRGPILPATVDVERERVVDFREDRYGARAHDRSDGRDEGERGNDHLVAAAHTERGQRATKGRGAARRCECETGAERLARRGL